MTWNEVKTFAEAEHTAGRITGKEYASFMLGALQTQMQIDADVSLRAAQVASMQIEDAIKQAQSAKDLLVKDAQIASAAKDLLVKDAQIASEMSRKAVLDQQKLTEIQQTAKAAYEVTYLLPVQKTHTENQALMVARQTTAFDDKRRVEKAQHMSNAVGMIYASGSTVPSDAWTEVKNKIDLI